MTTMNHYRGMDAILGQLEVVRFRRWLLRLLTGIVATATVVLASLFVTAAVAGFWPDQPPATLRWALLTAIFVAIAGSLGWSVLRAAMWRQNPAQTARFLEQSLPNVRNELINSVLLSRDADQASPQLVQMAILEAADDLRTTDLRRGISLRSLRRWGIALGAAAVLLAAFGGLQPGVFHRGLLAVLAPASYVPLDNPIELVSITPGDTTVFAGEPVTIVAKIRNDARRRFAARIHIEGLPDPRPMLASNANSTYTCILERVDQTLRYTVRIGGARWPAEKPYYTITVLKRVEVEGLDVQYMYPPYTGLADKKVINSDGYLEAPVGTRAAITLRISQPVPIVMLRTEGGSPVAMKPGVGSRSFKTVIPIDADGAYRLVLEDRGGNVLQQLPELGNGRGRRETHSAAGRSLMNGYYRIHAIPDTAPRIEFLSPARDVALPPDGTLAMKIKAFDKFALTDLRLWGVVEGTDRKLIDESFPVAEQAEKIVDYDFKIPATFPADGSVVIVYQAEATDNRKLPGAGPQTTRTRKFKIVVQDSAKVAAERQRKYEELRRRLLAILKMQETARVDSEICWKRHTKLAQVTSTAANIAVSQRNIRTELLDLAEKFDFPVEMVSVQRALAILANNEAQLAIDQAKVLSTLRAFSGRNHAARMLAGTQDRIIDAIQTLLAIVPTLNKDANAKDDRPSAGDLPPEARERLAKLKADLEKFIDAQKKIIQASERLAKKPVDAFGAADEKLLKELQATQDKWEKFLNESVTDFSKLAQQDFSNPVTLKELIAVKSDITMAKDALKKKAVEIATALEDNGIENAESLTANLEKWLPDEPDRIKWSMEDPGDGQENVEMPELPTELEDLVGDLLEQEEDLFDEMDDLTSKYTMSGDKGIGWDAMDGPIANMNAQGVTGNQLPNTNEMGGRSGEGRTGKSSGEFVEDKAVGKGGRRTPTRLTGEPFQKGQVNDVSKTPPGGATGGGKISGSGAEGLEGPVPPPLAKELKRLAGKQAALVNSAERLRARFKADDYSNFRFLQAITLMNRVRRDLAEYRYQNVLRARKETLGAIRQTRLLLSGEIDVAADSSSPMPKYVRDNVADAMKGKLPAAYRDVLHQYYRRISEQAPGE